MAVDGAYEVSIQTPMGEQKAKMELKAEGNNLTGKIEGMMGVDPIQSGTVNGDEFEFMIEATTPMGPMAITMKGKVEGDDLTGEATTPLGPAPVTGKRV
jgi:hypothetical protein